MSESQGNAPVQSTGSEGPATPHEAVAGVEGSKPVNTRSGTDANKIMAEMFSEEDLAIEAEELESKSGGSKAPVTNVQIDKAVKAGEITKAEGQALKKKLTIKVDGREEAVEIDFNDEEALKREFQKSRAFDKRAKEFSEKAKQFEQIMELFQKDPEAAMEKLGHDVDKFAEQRLEKAIEKAKKSPEQIEQEKMRAELEQLRKEKEQAQKDKEMAELEQYRNQVASEINNDIQSALENAKSFLPKNSDTLERVARYMVYAMQNGHSNVTAKEVLPLVEKEYKDQLKRLFDVSSEEIVEMLVGENNIDRLRKKRIAKQRAARTETARQLTQDTGKTTSTKEREEREKAKQPKRSFNSFFKIGNE